MGVNFSLVSIVDHENLKSFSEGICLRFGRIFK